MKPLAVIWARLCKLSWQFFQWGEIAVALALADGVGHLLEKAIAVLGLRLPQFSSYWPKLWSFSQGVVSFSEKGIAVLAVVYFAIVLSAKLSHVKIFRSGRLSRHLHEMLMTTVDRIPTANQNYRDKAKNQTAKKANIAVRKSFVLLYKGEVIVFVRVPRQIETREKLFNYLDAVADDLSRTTGMTSSTWQDVTNAMTFSSYKIMRFKR